MKKTIMLAIIGASIAFAEPKAEPTVFKQKKYFGPIPYNSLQVGVGFLDGADFDYLFEHLDIWASKRNGFDTWEEVSNSPYAHMRYERQLTPNHFFKSAASLAYISSSSVGEYYAQFPDTTLFLTFERDISVYLLALDIGFSYYFTSPEPQRASPYAGGGFSAVIPMVRLKTDCMDDGKPFSNPAENVSENSLQAGLHLEFGLNYYFSDRYAAGLEGRYQMSQSKFDIHGGNFDLKYSGIVFTLNFIYFL